jgi:hypothetical protein
MVLAETVCDGTTFKTGRGFLPELFKLGFPEKAAHDPVSGWGKKVDHR